MYLIFFDEAKNDPDYAYYHLGGICIAEQHLSDIEAKINALAIESFGSSVLENGTEFHAAEIYHRKKHFKEWIDPTKRAELLGKFIDILSADEVGRISIVINCAKLHDSQSAEDIGFMFLVERANSLMRGRQALGMLIGDRESDQLAARSARSLSNYRAKGTDFAYGTQISNLVDSVHFTQSHLSRFLQLADIYTWLKQFRHRNAGSDNERHKMILDLANREHVNLWPNKYKLWPTEN